MTSEEGERRLAAIMYTDMVGYTALGQRNESLSLALVEEQRKLIRPILARHNGREVKTMGDAFLVEFPNALDAVRCAYDIQRATREFNISLSTEKRIHLRIGLHLGDVVEFQGDISGDAVNVASRIEPLAEDGGVCLTRQVYESTYSKFEMPLVSIGMKPLKNVSEPMEVYKMEMPWEQFVPTKAAAYPKDRVAILPFANFSPDPNDGYFSDGLTEEMISAVSKIPQLSVISRTSVMGYKGKDKKASEIAKELHVGTLMEGSVRKAANRVRITVQLIEAGSDRHIWVENFDRNLEDIFAVQSEVAEKVATSLQIKLTDEVRNRIERGSTSNPEAYTQYLKGRIRLWRFEWDSLRTAIDCFEMALRLDPNYALSYCGLSNAYWFLAGIEMMEPKVAYQRTEMYARKALELDEDLPEAHVALHGVLWDKYDFEGAESELKKALELNPSLAEAYVWLSALHLIRGERKEANESLNQAERLNPLSVHVGSWLLYSGQYDRAIRHLKNALEYDPDNSLALDNLGMAHIQMGLIDEGLAEVRHAIEAGGSFDSDLAYAYVKAGRREEAKRLLDSHLEPGRSKHVSTTRLAGIYAVLGEKDSALEWLEKAFEERAGYLPCTRCDFVFESVWDEPRFKAIMKRMGLEAN